MPQSCPAAGPQCSITVWIGHCQALVVWTQARHTFEGRLGLGMPTSYQIFILGWTLSSGSENAKFVCEAQPYFPFLSLLIEVLSSAIPVAGAPLVTATTTAVSSVLLAPSVFQQTVTRSSDLERKASSPSPLTIGTPESQRKPSIILSKSQLQDTLIHLIKNDSSFLSTLHEVYLQVLTKNKDNHNLWLEQSKSKGRVLTSETNRLHHGNFWAEHRVWESWNWAYEKETHFLRMFSKWHSQW